MFADSLADDGLGLKTRQKGDKLLLSYPIAILAADIEDRVCHKTKTHRGFAAES
jgi:hypothetical protein